MSVTSAIQVTSKIYFLMYFIENLSDLKANDFLFKEVSYTHHAVENTKYN